MLVELQAQHPTYLHFTDKDGLPCNEVYDIYQDAEGYMWFGTDYGLVRYNGHTFKAYKNIQQKGTTLTHFIEDTKGRLWLQNFQGQLFYVEDDSLYYFEPLEELDALVFYSYLVDASGNVWVHDNARNVWIYLEKEQRWHHVQFEDARFAIRGIKQHKDKVYIITSLFLVAFSDLEPAFEYAEQLLRHIPEQIRMIGGEPNISVDPKIHIWDDRILITRTTGEFSALMHENNRLNLVGPSDENRKFEVDMINNNQTNSIVRDRNKLVWALTKQHGAIALWYDNRSKRLEEPLQLFPNESISDLFLDREGNYWVSSLKNGLYVIPNLDCQLYTSENSNLEETARNLMCKVDSVHIAWSGTDGRLYEYNIDDQTVKKYTVAHKKKGMILTHKYQQLIYITGSGYLYNLKKKTAKARTQVNAIKSSWNGKNGVFDSESSLMVANGMMGWWAVNLVNDGMERYANWDTRALKVAKGSASWVEWHAPTKSRIVAKPDKIDIYQANKPLFSLLDEKKQPIIAQKMKVASDGMLWINTQNRGVYGFDSTLQLKYHWTKKDGLISDIIRQIAVDDDNNLWFLAAQGIQCWNPITHEERAYTLEDGLPTLDIRKMVIVGNKMWLSTADGLVSFPLDLNASNKIGPPIRIKRIAINDKNSLLQEHYELNYQQNYLAIYVEGLSYRSQGKAQYKYRMLGIDSTWRYQPSSVDWMRFPQLGAGDYTFEVLCINEDGVGSTSPARVTFSIQPPYWQTWSFQGALYLSGILITMGIVLFGVRLKRREERQQNYVNVLKMQALQSQMNPHFIFNVLTAVQNLWLQHKNELALNMQSTFAKLLRKIFQYSNAPNITIEEEQAFLHNYLDLEQIRFEHQVNIKFIIEKELLDGHYCIPPLIIQPIIENSFKHGLFHKDSDRKLLIQLKKEEVYLHCVVEDNGVGRSNKKKHKRASGQNTTQERLNILQENIIKSPHPNNNFKITDLVNQEGKPIGTRVELWIPFV